MSEGEGEERRDFEMQTRAMSEREGEGQREGEGEGERETQREGEGEGEIERKGEGERETQTEGEGEGEGEGQREGEGEGEGEGEEEEEEEVEELTEFELQKLALGNKVALGNESVVGSLIPSDERSYKLTNRIFEGKKPLYSVLFNFIDARFFRYFVSAAGNSINLYNCLEDGGISLLHSYADEDKKESFFTTSWACSLDGNPFIVAGGFKGMIRVLNASDVNDEIIHKTLVGHGNAVNEIKTQHMRPQLVLSAGKDESVRLWNVETGICILIFAGTGGHRFEVLSVDFHPTDMTRFISCGMDTTVKIWSMKEFWKTVEKSFTWKGVTSAFPTKNVQLPIFSASVHTTYVDCNRWFGDYILSKSVENEILLWEPQLKEKNSHMEGTADVLLRYPIPNTHVWFIKFSCDLYFNYLSIGNLRGNVYVWDLNTCPPVLVTELSHNLSNTVIRQTAMSADGNTIIAASEDGTIWRWDVTKAAKSATTKSRRVCARK